MNQKKKVFSIVLGFALFFCAGGFFLIKEYVFAREITLYPRSENSWVGDPMPFFDGENFQVFYLEDLRDGDLGFHPWSLLGTTNFYEYSDKGMVIPYVNDESSQELALGTGSVIEDENGLYHAFYTSHNGNLEPKEALLHAISEDLENWEKLPENTFFGSEMYEQNDFRDPFVFYNEDNENFWMLITTRKNDTGVIALYTSEDLHHWQDQGVFFENDMGTDSNLECPSLIFFNDKWYLAFSDQWPDRVVHYRVADSLDDEFVIPEDDTWDGSGFYAGRLETNGESLFVFGWVPTKEEYSDLGSYNWAGNLVVHELVQQEDGTLKPKLPQEAFEAVSKNRSLPVVGQSDQASVKERDFTLLSRDEIEWIRFENSESTTIVQGELHPDSENMTFGFRFNARENTEPNLTIALHPGRDQVSFYNRPSSAIETVDPQSFVSLNMDKNPIHFQLVKEDTVVALYLNNEKVLTTRMFQQADQPWDIYAENGSLTIRNLRY